MKRKNKAFNLVALVAGILLSGCATIVNDPNIPLTFSFSDGSSGQCTFKNKRGVWSSAIPTQGVMIRRSDDALVYDCTTEDGREADGIIKSETEGGKMAASVIFWDFGITDSITDMHRTYQGNVVIPVPANRTGQVSDSVSGERVSAIEYYGEAEEEVNTKTYDKNLWAKAFVQAEGDEQKRVAKYIELRGNQLYSEKTGVVVGTISNQESASEKESAALDASGIYRSEISGNMSHLVPDTSIKIKLVQSGNKITGTFFGAKGYIDGIIDGNTIKFGGRMPYGTYGVSGKWVFTEGYKEAAGDARSHVTKGYWNLTRIE